MIKSITDIAKKLKEKKLKEVEGYLKKVIHPVIRGDMYEGITKSIVKKIFGELPDIKVCEGFIKNYRNGRISHQTDVIIYFGEAELIPETSHYVVPIDNVIATIEVKKTFKKKEFHDFYEKQSAIYDLVDEKIPFDRDYFSILKKKIFGRLEINDEIVKKSTKLKYYLYNILKLESAEPLRICIGYDGIKKEKTLRENLVNVILERNKKGLLHTGMNSLPSLVIAGDNCLVKMIGCPFASPFEDPYPIMTSYSGDVLKVFLVMIIFKIESKLPILFELEIDDFSSFNLNSFLFASIDEQNNDATQFSMCDLSTKEMKKNKYVEKEWKPVEITNFEFVVATILAELSHHQEPRIPITDALFSGRNLEADMKNLIINRYVSINDNMVELISIEAVLVIWRGKYLIGENNANQMSEWIKHNMKTNKC